MDTAGLYSTVQAIKQKSRGMKGTNQLIGIAFLRNQVWSTLCPRTGSSHNGNPGCEVRVRIVASTYPPAPVVPCIHTATFYENLTIKFAHCGGTETATSFLDETNVISVSTNNTGTSSRPIFVRPLRFYATGTHHFHVHTRYVITYTIRPFWCRLVMQLPGHPGPCQSFRTCLTYAR